MKRYLLVLLSILIGSQAWMQIPTGYYNGTDNLSGAALRQALHDIIDNHTVVSYSSLWTHFQQTDKKPDNSVWDMYTDIPGGTPVYSFTFISDQCGNYSQEGDCYNREHTWPQSWFNSASPMKTDLFQVYPTDGYVNGQRSNYPYGEVGTASFTSSNGSKVGSCTYPGYSGTVFEPIDEYKGDLARTYFYMATRYYNEDAGWQTNGMVSGADILPWAQNMLMEWSVNDPVSAKEIERNNKVYAIQGNRNPFIDHPEFAMLIFSSNYPQPQFTSIPVELATVNALYEYVISASDPGALPLSFSAENLPAWLTLTDNGNNTATLSGVPQSGDSGSFGIAIQVANPYSMPVTQSFTIAVSPVTGISESDVQELTVGVYPNPFGNGFTITLNSLPVDNISVFDIMGHRVQSVPVIPGGGEQINLDATAWPDGIYFVRAYSSLLPTRNIRVIKAKR